MAQENESAKAGRAAAARTGRLPELAGRSCAFVLVVAFSRVVEALRPRMAVDRCRRRRGEEWGVAGTALPCT